MSDKLYMPPVIGWFLFDKSLGSISDNHGNRVSAWSAKCSNGHEEGLRMFSLDRLWLEQKLKFAAFGDMQGIMKGTVDLGTLPSPIAEYCDKRVNTSAVREK